MTSINIFRRLLTFVLDSYKKRDCGHWRRKIRYCTESFENGTSYAGASYNNRMESTVFARISSFSCCKYFI